MQHPPPARPHQAAAGQQLQQFQRSYHVDAHAGPSTPPSPQNAYLDTCPSTPTSTHFRRTPITPPRLAFFPSRSPQGTPKASNSDSASNSRPRNPSPPIALDEEGSLLAYRSTLSPNEKPTPVKPLPTCSETANYRLPQPMTTFAFPPRELEKEGECFCGSRAEEDSIYCSVVCGRLDAMKMLCAGEVESEDKIHGGGTRSESHYRRLGVFELQKLGNHREEAALKAKEKTRRVGAWRYMSSNSSQSSGSSPSTSSRGSPIPSPIKANFSPSPLPSTSSRPSPSADSIMPLSRYPLIRTLSNATTHSSVPSLSSSIASYSTSSSTRSSPISPSFPSTAHTGRSPFYTSQHFFDDQEDEEAEEIYDSYHNTEPLSLGMGSKEIQSSRYAFESSGNDEGREEELRDRVCSIRLGAKTPRERMHGGINATKHRPKLSIDDLIGIMRG